jgi:hypothetical protein
MALIPPLWSCREDVFEILYNIVLPLALGRDATKNLFPCTGRVSRKDFIKQGTFKQILKDG